MGYCAESGDNLLPTFRKNLSVPYSGVKNPRSNFVPSFGTSFPETSVTNDHFSVRNSPGERSSHRRRGGIMHHAKTVLSFDLIGFSFLYGCHYKECCVLRCDAVWFGGFLSLYYQTKQRYIPEHSNHLFRTCYKFTVSTDVLNEIHLDEGVDLS
jgi:hypothetical protein